MIKVIHNGNYCYQPPHNLSILFLNWIVPSRLKLDEIVRGLMDDKHVMDCFNHRLTYSMNPETAITCTRGHINLVFEMH